jgi:hypothetical protein
MKRSTKVKAIALWYAIAHNLRRAVSLCAALAAPAHERDARGQGGPAEPAL